MIAITACKSFASTEHNIIGIARELIEIIKENPEYDFATCEFEGVALYAYKNTSEKEIYDAYTEGKTRQMMPDLRRIRGRR